MANIYYLQSSTPSLSEEIHETHLQDHLAHNLFGSHILSSFLCGLSYHHQQPLPRLRLRWPPHCMPRHHLQRGRRRCPAYDQGRAPPTPTQEISRRRAAASHAASLLNLQMNDPRQQSALSDCVELMDLSRDRLDESATALLQLSNRSKSHSDVHSWLSTVLTNHVTCIDGLHGQAKSAMKPDMDHLVALASTSLAVVSSVSPPGDEDETLLTMNKYPSWLGFKDRSLLEARAKAIQPNVVVAKDGSGKYRTVQEGVNSVPDNGKTRYVIYVKRGVYKEQVQIGKKKKNVMLVGDGMDATIITGSLNVVDGSTTFDSATVGIYVLLILA